MVSGLTANKMVGEFAEYLVKNGGTFTITEVTEMFGAEQILMNRAINQEIFRPQSTHHQTARLYPAIRRHGKWQSVVRK